MKHSRSGSDVTEVLARVCAVLERAPAGMHELAEPRTVLDAELPPVLAETYRRFDGAELFQGMLILLPSREIEKREGRYSVGEESGDDIFVGAVDGSVWRLEKDTGEWLPEGSSFDRWLLGVIEAEGLMYDADGEYRDELFDEGGELTADAAARRERRILDRDRSAVAPRWRLARALGRLDRIDDARQELERVVELAPEFAWAWFDLARLSERAGELSGAIEEACEAGQAAAETDTSLAGYFFAHAARLASRAGEESRRRALARRALEVDPELVARNSDGARALFEEGDAHAARELVELALAIDPADGAARELLGFFASRGEP